MQYQVVSSPWLHKATPIALSVVAGAGVVGTAVLAAKATPDAIERKKEAEEKKGEPLTKWEAFKVMFPSYIPAGTTGLVTLASIAGLSIHDNATQSKLAGVVASGNQIINGISRKYASLRSEVAEKHPEILKEFDERSLEDQWTEYVHERMKKFAWCNSLFPGFESPEDWGKVQLMCLEYGNGIPDENGHDLIFFYASPGDVMSAIYNINGQYQERGIVSVADFFQYMHLPRTDLSVRLVWDAEVLNTEWNMNFIGFHSREYALEDNVPDPATCILLQPDIPPLAEGYAEGMEYPSIYCPKE